MKIYLHKEKKTFTWKNNKLEEKKSISSVQVGTRGCTQKYGYIKKMKKNILKKLIPIIILGAFILYLTCKNRALNLKSIISDSIILLGCFCKILGDSPMSSLVFWIMQILKCIDVNI